MLFDECMVTKILILGAENMIQKRSFKCSVVSVSVSVSLPIYLTLSAQEKGVPGPLPVYFSPDEDFAGRQHRLQDQEH